MIRKRVAASMLVLAIATPAAAWAPVLAGRMDVQPTSKLWVEGTSTVRSYKCEASKLTGNVELRGDKAPAALAELSQAAQSGELSVAVASLECGNGTMNEHLRKALKASENPTIKFTLTSPQVAADGTAKISGKLSIAGKENPVVLSGTVTQEADGLRLKGSKELKMTEFGVKPPSLMMGTMKVGDLVKVRYELVLKA